MSLANKCFLVTLNISIWTARKHDRKVSKEIEDQHGAFEAGRYNKKLAKDESLKSIYKIANELRSLHYSLTLPWSDSGMRIMSAKIYFEYIKKHNKLKTTFNKEVSAFIDSYENIIQNAKQRLQDMFCQDDYPTSDQIENKFDVKLEFMPLSKGEDFRVLIEKEQYNDIVNSIETDYKKKFNRGKIHLRDMIQEKFLALIETLPPGKRLHRTTFNDVRNLSKLISSLNVFESYSLDIVASAISNLFILEDFDTMRKDKAVRKRLHYDCKKLYDKYFGGI